MNFGWLGNQFGSGGCSLGWCGPPVLRSGSRRAGATLRPSGGTLRGECRLGFPALPMVFLFFFGPFGRRGVLLAENLESDHPDLVRLFLLITCFHKVGETVLDDALNHDVGQFFLFPDDEIAQIHEDVTEVDFPFEADVRMTLDDLREAAEFFVLMTPSDAVSVDLIVHKLRYQTNALSEVVD